jgi:hypothetical protein
VSEIPHPACVLETVWPQSHFSAQRLTAKENDRSRNRQNVRQLEGEYDILEQAFSEQQGDLSVTCIRLLFLASLHLFVAHVTAFRLIVSRNGVSGL